MERIKVGVKVRPLIPREKARGCDVHWQAVSDTTISQVEPATGRAKGDLHTFDHVFGPESSNTEVFEVLVKPIVESAVRGFNGTIFAYGQTASGKTYTMMGDQYEPGIIPQAVNLIFNTIENSHGREFLLRVCYMEIYNEKIHDLLCKSNRNLKISEDNSGNVLVKDLEETITSSSQMVMDLMKRGEAIRKIGVTNMNERSSRSHSIFRVIIESRAVGSETDEAIQVSHLNLVDLAGSERSGATGAVGEQFKEGCAINKSLFTLGKVISQLSEGQSSYVNFRDSKLTRILQSSLGGNALTAIVCAVTPAALEETSSTLGFASRARNIQNTAQVNEVLTEGALLKRYIKQINRLKSEISSIEEEKNAENKQLQIQNSLLQERLSRLKDALLVSNPEDADQSESCEQKVKKLRRRTWSAPNRNVCRLSLAFPMTKKKTESVSALDNINEEDSRLSILSTKSDLDESMFATPLEEFERALMKAEREKSIDWLPSADFLEDDTLSKSVEDETENTPAPNYVQTRRNRGHLRLDDDFVSDTPPAKLRAKIRDVEKELEEINEFTKLEKQMFDESLIEENKALNNELSRLKNELQDCRAQCESLQEIKKHQENLKLSDRNSHDLQVLLLDTTKEVSKLNDEKKELSKKLSDAEAQCVDLGKIKEELALMDKELSESRNEKRLLKTSLAKQEEQLHLLQNGKDDFDFQFEIMRRNYEKRIKDLTVALEDARHEMTPQHVMRHNDNGGLYSLPEETTHDELVQQLETKQERICDLEHQLSVLSTSLSAKTASEEELSAAKKLIIDNDSEVDHKVDEGLIPLVEKLILSAKVAEENCKSLEEKMTVLQKEQGELLSSFEDVKSSLVKLEEEKQTCSTELATARSDIEKLMTTNAALVEGLNSKDIDAAKHGVEIQSLLDRISVLESSAATEMEPELKQMSDSNLNLSNQLTHSNEEIKCLKEENNLLKEAMASKEEVILLSAAELEAVKSQLNDLINSPKSHLNSSKLVMDDSICQKCKELDEKVCAAKSLLCNSIDDLNCDESMTLESLIQLLTVSLKDTREKCILLEQRSEMCDKNFKSKEVELEELHERCGKSELLQDEIISLKKANEILSEELEAKELNINESAVEMEHLRKQIASLESALISKGQESNESHEDVHTVQFSVQNEIENLEKINKNLLSDLDKKDKLVNEAAVEMEHLREQIVKLECVKSAYCESPVNNDIDSRSFDSEKQLHSLAEFDGDHVNEIKVLQERCLIAEEELRVVRSILCQRDEDINISTPLASLIADLVESCAKNVVAESENIKLPTVIEDETSEALVEHKIKIDELVSTKDSLMSELDCKNSLLADTEVELKQLKERLQELNNKPTTEPNLSEQLLHHKNEVLILKSEKEALEVELQSKDAVIKESQLELVQIQDLLKVLQGDGMTEECCQKCTVFSNELASSQKLLSSELKDMELNEKASIPDLVNRILVLFNRVNEECAELKQEVLKETNSKLSIQEHVDTLQKKCDSLQSEICNTRQTLLTELKGMSDNGAIDELPLPLLVSEFLASVILVQQRVASVLQQKVDDSSRELEATLQRESECQRIIEELRCEVKHYSAKNESLKDALEDLKQEDHDTHCLVGTLNRLKILVNATESISYDDLIFMFENKLLTLCSKSDEVEHLQLEVQQQIAENDVLRTSITALEKQVSEQKEMIKTLELGADNAQQAITINKQKLEKLKEETSHERAQVDDLKMEIVQKEELVVKLERQLSELQQKVDGTSVEIGLINDLKAVITSKEEELLQLEANLRQLSVDLSEERSKSDNLSEEVVQKQELVVKLQRQLSELQQRVDDLSAESGLVSNLKADLTSKEEELLQLEANLRQLSVDLTGERSKSDNLSEQVVQKQELIVELEMKLSELQQKVDYQSGEIGLVNDLKADVTSKEEELSQLEAKLHQVLRDFTEERSKSDNFSQELLKEGRLVDDLKKELMGKSELIDELKEEMSKVQQNLQAQIKLVAGKDLLHTKATSLYNELTEKKELISRLESDLSAKTSILHEKENTIESLQKSVAGLDEKLNTLQSELMKSKAEKELALKNLALKSSVTPTEAMQELKAENEFLKQQHEEVLKSSRDMRTRNRKLQVEINKLKEKLEEDKKSTSGALTEVSLLRSQLDEEISKRKQLESELDQISKLERSKPSSRVSELQKKRASLDVKHSKEEIENLKSKEEIYKIEITSKSQDLTNLKKIVKEKEEMIAQLLDCPKCKDKLGKIEELEKDKSDLDKECEDLLSWGRSHEKNYNELVDKFAELLKDLAEARLKLTTVAVGKIQFLSNLCKESVSALDRITAERVEMQLSAKEIAARNANGRAADFSKKIQEATCNVILLENLCADLKKESDSVLNIVEESLTIWRKLPTQKSKTMKCSECSALSEWGKREEAKVMKLEDLVSQLEDKINLLEHEKKQFNTRSRRKQVELGGEERSKALCSDCVILKEALQSQKSEIADKNAEIVHLKIGQQLQNKPFEETVKRLESQVLRFKDENASLKSEMRRALKNYETTVRETNRKAAKVNIATQTTESTSDIYRSQYWSGAPSGIVEEANKAIYENMLRKLEQEKEAYKNLCVKRKERIEQLEKERIKNFNKENQENDEPNKSTYFTRSRKNN